MIKQTFDVFYQINIEFVKLESGLKCVKMDGSS